MARREPRLFFVACFVVLYSSLAGADGFFQQGQKHSDRKERKGFAKDAIKSGL